MIIPTHKPEVSTATTDLQFTCDPFADAIKTTAEKKEPTSDQMHALNHFARRHGRCWRGQLRQCWDDGSDTREPNGYLLRQLRDDFGLKWLDSFNSKLGHTR